MAKDGIDIQTWIGENSDDGTFCVKVVVNSDDPQYKGGFATRAEAEQYAEDLPSLFARQMMIRQDPHYQAEGGTE